MCTVISYKGRNHYVARNLDMSSSYHEEIVFAPQHVPFRFLHVEDLYHHRCLIGITTRFDVFLFIMKQAMNTVSLWLDLISQTTQNITPMMKILLI